MNLRNVLFQRRAPHVLLIDLGRAGDLGRISFEPGQGGMRDYMSIKRLFDTMNRLDFLRSGLEGGRRNTADDVEPAGFGTSRMRF